MSTYFRILKAIIRENKKQTAFCFGIMLVMSVLQVAIPLAMKGMVAKIEEMPSVSLFLICIAIYAVMWLCYNFLNVKWYKHIDMLGEKVLWFIREKLYTAIWSFEQDTYSRLGKSFLKNVLFTDVINVYGNIILYSLNMFADFFMIFILLLVSFQVDVITTAILILAVVIGFVFSFLSKPVMADCSRIVNQSMKQENAVNDECVDAIELTRTNGLQDYYRNKVKNSIHDFIKTAIKSDQKSVFLQNLVEHYHQIMIMAITGFLVLHAQSTSAGTLVYYIFVTNLIIEKSRSIEGNLYRFMKNMAAFENIDSILNEAETENEDGEELSDISEIRFDKVGLVYENAARVFSDRSFTLKKGDAVLLKGGNGCGKSSTLKMIAGFLAPSEGDIRYNSISYKKLKRQSLYRNICYLNQEELLLNETLPEYISIMAHRDVSEKEYQTYASKVNLTKDYGRITDNGKSFSGGEKKKAIIMKLLARKEEVSVILLDEIEAGLDKESQVLIGQIEKELLQEREHFIIVKISHGEVANLECYNKVIELN